MESKGNEQINNNQKQLPMNWNPPPKILDSNPSALPIAQTVATSIDSQNLTPFRSITPPYGSGDKPMTDAESAAAAIVSLGALFGVPRQSTPPLFVPSSDSTRMADVSTSTSAQKSIEKKEAVGEKGFGNTNEDNEEENLKSSSRGDLGSSTASTSAVATKKQNTLKIKPIKKDIQKKREISPTSDKSGDLQSQEDSGTRKSQRLSSKTSKKSDLITIQEQKELSFIQPRSEKKSKRVQQATSYETDSQYNNNLSPNDFEVSSKASKATSAASKKDLVRSRKNARGGDSSAFRGVSCSGRDRKWQTRIRKGNKVFYLGRYFCEIEAALVYDDFANESKNEKRSCNFIEEVRKNPELRKAILTESEQHGYLPQKYYQYLDPEVAENLRHFPSRFENRNGGNRTFSTKHQHQQHIKDGSTHSFDDFGNEEKQWATTHPSNEPLAAASSASSASAASTSKNQMKKESTNQNVDEATALLMLATSPIQ